MSKQHLIDDAVQLGNDEETRPPLNDNWQARRELADALRRLNVAVMTAEVGTKSLRDFARQLNDEAARIEDSERLYSRASHRDKHAERYQERADFFYELSPITGMSNAAGMPIHVWTENGRVHAEATPDWTYEGQLGHLHGGVIALLFDEVLGAALHLVGGGGFTAYLKTDYLAPTPLNKTLRLKAEIARVEGRKRYITGELWVDDLKTAVCEGLYIIPKPAET